jgi:hypothetical protein
LRPAQSASGEHSGRDHRRHGEQAAPAESAAANAARQRTARPPSLAVRGCGAWI